jgi:hypothetical protein
MNFPGNESFPRHSVRQFVVTDTSVPFDFPELDSLSFHPFLKMGDVRITRTQRKNIRNGPAVRYDCGCFVRGVFRQPIQRAYRGVNLTVI